MPLGTEVSLNRGDIVLDGDPAPPWKGVQQPPSLFGPCLLWPNGRPSQQLHEVLLITQLAQLPIVFTCYGRPVE